MRHLSVEFNLYLQEAHQLLNFFHIPHSAFKVLCPKIIYESFFIILKNKNVLITVNACDMRQCVYYGTV